MELLEIQSVTADNYGGIVDKIIAEKPAKNVEEYLKQYDPKQHAIFDQTKRPNKTKKAGGQDIPVPVARIAIAKQKQITQTASAFLCGNPIKLNSSPAEGVETEFLQLVTKVWADNKLDYESMQLAELMMSETECAELWYTQAAEPEYWANTAAPGAAYKLRMRVLANSMGDKLYPVFDMAGDMIAFGRGYFVKVGDKNEEHFDLYTDTKIYKGTKGGDAWALVPEANVVGKIPVIYYSQSLPEWSDVQEMIERLEVSVSNHSDTNDYFGSPMVFVEGEITGFAEKGESGKILQGKSGAKAEYLTWDQSPESVKLEIENLLKFIHEITNTPPINMEEVKGMGNISGIALKLLFLGAHLKAARKVAIFGKCIQRRINYLKSAVAIISVMHAKALGLTITPKFEFYLPKNELEIITMLTDATGSGKAVMSQESAVRQNPLVTDADAEIAKMQEEGSFGSDIEAA